MRSVLTLCALVLLLILGAAPALAAPVDFVPLIDVGVQILAAVLLAVGTWAIGRLLRKFNLEIDDKQRAAIYAAMDTAINYGRQKAMAAAAKHGTIDVKNEVAAAAASYLVSKVPGALEHFKITPDKLAEMILARLPADPPPAG